MSGQDLIAKWQEQNNAFHFEGESELKNLESLCELLGYTRDGFLHGDPLNKFLSSNPGAQEALIDWITEELDRSTEWREALEQEVGAEDPGEDEDEDDED